MLAAAGMIVTRQMGGLRLVTQPDHAHFAAELLSLWREPDLVEHPRRRLLLQAIREHDNGWREADAAPRVDPATGAPYGFLDLPSEHRLEIWHRGIHRFVEEAPYIALMIAEHARALLGAREGDEPQRQLLEALEELRPDLLARAALTDQEAAADYRWLELADTLSLAVCVPWLEPLRRPPWRAAVRADRLLLDPLPLAGTTTFHVSFRNVPDRRYHGDADLGAELAAAHWRRFPVRVTDTARAPL